MEEKESSMPELDITKIQNRIIGVGLIPDRETALKLADRIKRPVEISDEDEFTYLIIPDLNTNVQTIRHQTLVRTDVPLGQIDQTIQETADLIQHLWETTKPAIINFNSMSGMAESETARERNEYPFDMGMNTLQATIEAETPRQEFAKMHNGNEKKMVSSEENDTRFLCQISWSTLDLNLSLHTVRLRAEAHIPGMGLPNSIYLMTIYETLIQQLRLRLLAGI